MITDIKCPHCGNELLSRMEVRVMEPVYYTKLRLVEDKVLRVDPCVRGDDYGDCGGEPEFWCKNCSHVFQVPAELEVEFSSEED